MAASIQQTNNGGANNEWSKYRCIENDLQLINRNYVSLNEQEKKLRNEDIHLVLNKLIAEMKKVDKLFDQMYQTILYAGSYYDGLKVGEPDEYDLDLILKLPAIRYENLLLKTVSNKPGYLTVQMKQTDIDTFIKDQRFQDYKTIYKKWIDTTNGYILPDEMRRWIQSVVTRALLNKPFALIANHTVTYKNSGPAITLQVKGRYNYDIDLVPVLQMMSPIWPPQPVRQIPNGCKKTSWYLVPKPLKSNTNGSNKNIYWRLALTEQEFQLINGMERLKPALRLLKKLRDTQNFKIIASYYLKTICLWEMDKRENDRMWKSAPLSGVFMHLLKKFSEHMREQNIPYYWVKSNNLLNAIDNKIALENIHHRLLVIINKIENDPRLLPTFLLTKEEYNDFCNRRSTHVNNNANNLINETTSNDTKNNNDQSRCILC